MIATKTMKSFLFALLACCAFLMWGTEKAAASISDAKAINLNQTYKGVLKDYDQKDFYKFTISAPGNITGNKTKTQFYLGWRDYEQFRPGV
ncbi:MULTISPECIES: hypothetical protein [Cytobacillus]|uniref:hypothetical protein n=1 Tax=Cytobacillus TaxID=2675230 RepID=UPI00203D88CD|nr:MULTISPECIES: hypothetical protein [Cytobacillus]MCM3391509.1 hypothetical protein [Cytobacillus oceanisediminis]UQX53782.1 hypothetical protein M5V91_24305 [Cytobacillus pseudoceanisediminis]